MADSATMKERMSSVTQLFHQPFKRYNAGLDTDLNEDFRMDPLDADELLERYAEAFNLDPGTIRFDEYFPEDFTALYDPLTLWLLVGSAQAGYCPGKRSCLVKEMIYILFFSALSSKSAGTR